MRVAGVRYDSPRRFTWRQRLFLACVPSLIGLVLRAIMATCRKEIREGQHRETLIEKEGHYIIALWHETVAGAVPFYGGTDAHTLTSYSFDGELAARVVRHFGVGSLRGSSSAGGSEALADMAKAIRQVSIVGITLDGPRGPRRQAKAGAIILAARTGYSLLPQVVVATKVWRLRSWDRMAIPKPFARVVMAYGTPLPPPEDDSEAAVEARRAELETVLNALQEGLEADMGVSKD